MIPDWLSLLASYLGTGGVTACVLQMREVTRKRNYPIILAVLLWPLFLIGGAFFQRNKSKPDPSSIPPDQGTLDIAFWREQLTSDSPIEQELAKQMLAMWDVPEKAPTQLAEAATIAENYLSQKKPPTEVAMPEKKLEKVRLASPSLVPEKPLIEYCVVCNGSGWGNRRCMTCNGIGFVATTAVDSPSPITRQQVEKTLQTGALSPLPPALRHYAQSYEKVVEEALEELQRQMAEAERQNRAWLVDLIVDETKELISTPAPALPGIGGEYDPDPSARSWNAHQRLGMLIKQIVLSHAPQLAAAHKAALTDNPAGLRLADYYAARFQYVNRSTKRTTP